MKRTILILMLTCTITMIPFTGAQATGRGPCSEARYEVTRSMGPDLRTRRVKALIRCVFDTLGIGAQVPTAYAIADRESSFYPWATNPAGGGACRPWTSSAFGSCGTFQHLASYWPGRARSYLPDRYFPNRTPGVLQLRANVWVTARMFKAGERCHWEAPSYCA